MHWKRKIITVFCLLIGSLCIARDNETDSLISLAQTTKDDSVKIDTWISLAASHALSEPEEAMLYAKNALAAAEKDDNERGKAYAYKWLGIINNYSGNYYDALVYSNKSLNIFQAMNDDVGISNLLNNIGAFYADRGEESKAIEFYLKSLQLAEQTGNKIRIQTSLANIGVVYSRNPATRKKALDYYLQALVYGEETKDEEFLGTIYTNVGEVYVARDQFDSAHIFFAKALDAFGNSPTTAFTYNDLGKLYKKQQLADSAYYYFRKAYTIASLVSSSYDLAQSQLGIAQVQMQEHRYADAVKSYKQAMNIAIDQSLTTELKEIYEGLASAYKLSGDYKNAYVYKDSLTSLYNSENQKKINFTTATFEYSIELQKQSGQIDQLLKERATQQLKLEKEQLQKNTSVAILAVLAIVAIIMLRNIRQRKKLTNILYKQKEEIGRQKTSVEEALSELKSTQSQLIHAEKMASLGELTAGIAHEIQNPLNFVNNFSEVSNELLEEMSEELEKGDLEEIKEILKDIKINLSKINHHGKRADSIVKGMLQHSRTAMGNKEAADLNALTNEFVRLTYHGLKAKDKSFDVTLKTDFDSSIGEVKMIPQDIGRVILNLVNNAFYAATLNKTNGQHKEPTVWVSTQKSNGSVYISVKDNGPGIPDAIREKIFQPFFTTKPTGEGTGLGLSLSYDIVKAHNGEIVLETKEGEGTSFTVQLPA